MKEIKIRRPFGEPKASEPPACRDAMVALLEDGTLSVEGLLPWGSNYTFMGRVAQDSEEATVVYKPIRGERPLWDFPHGTLAHREVAAFVVSEALGWSFVPPTVLRDGPHGLGSVQLYMDVDQDAHFFTFREDPAYRLTLQKLALFDVVVNNADRKGGHCLRMDGGCICAIDHGVCFNSQPKLRTVIWDFAGEAVPPTLVADLCDFQTQIGTPGTPLVQNLMGLLAREEIASMRGRLASLLDAGRFPEPPENRRPFPWPLV